MIVGIIQAKNIDEAFSQVNNAKDACDIFEFRLDYLEEINYQMLKDFTLKTHTPLIFTLRASDQNGFYQGMESERLTIMMQLSDLKPAYIDIEHTVSDHFIEELHIRNPEIKIVRSYHDFDRTPQDLNNILKMMQHPDCTIYKIVTMANSSLDVLRMLHFIKGVEKNVTLAGHCMGEIGVPSRVLSPIFGSIFQYVSLHEAQSPASGCLTLKTCIDIYGAKYLKASTKIYAVLGDPIEKSLGHIFHNKIFQESESNAVYVKFKVTPSELSDFIKACQGLSIHGLSITMPLKREILKLIDYVEEAHDNIGAINTIRFNGNHLSGANTDGMGALNAIEKIQKVKGKKMIILGAGGSARAIATEAKNRQIGQLGIINRTLKNSEDFAVALQCLNFDFDSTDTSIFGKADFVINTLPSNIENTDTILATTIPLLSSKTLFMDINYNQPPSILKQAAIALGCQIVDGYEMFVQQALLQQEYWNFRLECIFNRTIVQPKC